MSFFFKLFMKTPCCHAHILSKNLLILWKTTLYYGPKIPCFHALFGPKNVNSVKTAIQFWQKKVKRMPIFYFSDFYEKNHCSHAPFLWINVNSLKKNTALMPIFCQKTSISWKPSANMSFFSIFLWKTTCSFPYLLKNVNSVKTTQYYGPKNSIGYHFFWYFKKETQLQSQICQKKCPLS